MYTATTESYTYVHTLFLHDALPISARGSCRVLLLDGLGRRHRTPGLPRDLDQQLAARTSDRQPSDRQKYHVVAGLRDHHAGRDWPADLWMGVFTQPRTRTTGAGKGPGARGRPHAVAKGAGQVPVRRGGA